MNEKYYVTDTDLSQRFPIYTRANVGEVFPDPVTPLTSTSALWDSELGWRDAWIRMGAFEPAEFPNESFAQLGVVGGYCYLNASLIRLFGERAPGLSWQDMDAQFFGSQPGIPPYEEMAGDARPDLMARIGETFGWALGMTSLDDLDQLTTDRQSTKQLRHDRPDYSAMSLAELWAYGMDRLPQHRKLFGQHLFTTYMATVPIGIISAVAEAVQRPELIMPIIAGIGQVDSAEPSHAMWALGRLIQADDSLRAVFDTGIHGAIAKIRGLDSVTARSFLTEFDKFLYEFGSRGPNEWESRSPSWETHPELALSAIDRMRLAGDEQNPAAQYEARATERAEATATLLGLVEPDPEMHGQLAAAIASTTAWLPGRERTKTNNIRLIHEMRMALREIGRRMVEAGAFREVEDFGFVKHDEYPAFLKDPMSLADVVQERRAAYDELCALVPPFVFVESPPSPETWERRGDSSAAKLNAGDTIQGLAGCTGVAEGTARVVLDSHDPSALEPGDILIAPITDPSWTPLFVPSAAVVVNVGAPLSHAIIVSRELGIPCVISATGATATIPDGARVRVDGSTGIVTVLSLGAAS